MAKTDAIRVPIEVEWRNDEAYRRGYEAGREAQAIPLIDVVEQIRERVMARWDERGGHLTMAGLTAILDDVARPASESSTAELEPDHSAGKCSCRGAALPVEEGEPE